MATDDVLQWAATLPAWQQDALRRIVQKGTPDESDKNEIMNNILAAHGIDVETPSTIDPIAAEHIPINRSAGPRTILCSIGPVTNANRLAENQALRFATNGLTVIYGENGSGKSGYCRIAKKICRSRVIDPILGNVFGEPSHQPASAHIRFQIEGEDIQELTWTDGEPSPEALSQICVFDNRTAAVYVDKENHIDYMPFEIDIMSGLGRLCTEIGNKIKLKLMM